MSCSTLKAEGAGTAHFRSMCALKFRSMKITREVGDFAARLRRGHVAWRRRCMTEMREKFREQGGEFHLPAAG